MKHDTEILILGAGPTGLTLACLLAHYQIPFRIIDSQIPPCAHSKALVLQPRTLESFEKINLASPFIEKGSKLKGLDLHRGKKHLVHVDFTSNIESPFNFPLALSQRETESVLLQYLNEKNIQIEKRKALEIKQNPKGHFEILVDRETSIHTKWLFGCDGPHSIVRSKLEISFTGSEESHGFWLADFIFQKDPFDRSSGHIFTQPFGSVVLIPFPPNIYRLIISRLEQEITEKNIFTFLEKYTNIQIPIEKVLWISKFYIHYRLAEKIQIGRAFLLGDAFHVHSPVGGQGMNTGIQDAFNLAWKFALVYQKKAPESILKSYAEERLENAQKLLKNTKRATKIADNNSFLIGEFRSHLFPMLLKYTSLSHRIANINSQLTIHYTKSSLIKNEVFKHSKPQAGQRFPHQFVYCFHSNQKKSLLEITKEMTHHLFFFNPKNENSSLNETEQIFKMIRDKKLPIELHIVCTEKFSPLSWMKESHLWADRKNEISEKWNLIHPSLYLVRPDGYIGYFTSKIHYLKFKSFLAKTFLLGS